MCLRLCLCVRVYVPIAAGVSAAVGLPAAAPAGPAGPAAASAQPPEARAAHHPAGTDGPAAALPHSGSVRRISAPRSTSSPQQRSQMSRQSVPECSMEANRVVQQKHFQGLSGSCLLPPAYVDDLPTSGFHNRREWIRNQVTLIFKILTHSRL